jgi:hypothetical protein
LPFLRFVRDKRGYENTYLVHTYRSRGKTRPRILYWFRTPPNVRVGRAALDEEAIRAVEENNPDLSFDWTKILQAPVIESERQERPDKRRRADPVREAPTAASAEVPADPAASPSVDAGAASSPAPEIRRGRRGRRRREAGGDESLAISEQVPQERGEMFQELPRAALPSVVDPDLTEQLEPDELLHEVPEPAEPDKTSAAEAVVGAEGVARLQARYAELLARISEHSGDATAVEALRSQAERLNPDAWVTAEEVRSGLEDYESVHAALRSALGRRRRRSRRGGARRARRRPGAGQAAAAGTSPEDVDAEIDHAPADDTGEVSGAHHEDGEPES